MDSRNQAAPLKPGEAHLWLFDLEHLPQVNEGWERHLSGEEIARSKRFIADKDRKRFVARRGILRQLLGRYCGTDPAWVSYQANPNGKLYLPSHPISFNLSKSGDWIALVFTLEKEAGVDIEQVRLIPELSLLAKRWFSPEEQAGLSVLPPSTQVEAFYHVWTQKEAFIKAQGMGLRQPLADFSVSVDPDEPARLMSIKNCPDDLSSWKMACFKPAADRRVAVCVRAEREIEVLVTVAENADFLSPVSSGKTEQSV